MQAEWAVPPVPKFPGRCSLWIFPHWWSGSCRFNLRILNLLKKKIIELGKRRDFLFLSCIIFEGPFCLLNPERKTWVKRKNSPWLMPSNPLHRPRPHSPGSKAVWKQAGCLAHCTLQDLQHLQCPAQCLHNLGFYNLAEWMNEEWMLVPACVCQKPWKLCFHPIIARSCLFKKASCVCKFSLKEHKFNIQHRNLFLPLKRDR